MPTHTFQDRLRLLGQGIVPEGSMVFPSRFQSGVSLDDAGNPVLAAPPPVVRITPWVPTPKTNFTRTFSPPPPPPPIIRLPSTGSGPDQFGPRGPSGGAPTAPVLRISPAIPPRIAFLNEAEEELQDQEDLLSDISRQASGAIGLDPRRTISAQIGQEAHEGGLIARTADAVVGGHFGQAFRAESRRAPADGGRGMVSTGTLNTLPCVPASYSRQIAKQIRRRRFACR